MTTTLRIIHWICRCLLAGVFIYSGYVKAKATLQFAVAITGYQIVPEQYIYPIAKYFPMGRDCTGADPLKRAENTLVVDRCRRPYDVFHRSSVNHSLSRNRYELRLLWVRGPDYMENPLAGWFFLCPGNVSGD